MGLLAGLLVVVGLVGVVVVEGCSTVQVKYGEAQNLLAIGRSMELPAPVPVAKAWKVVIHPVGTTSPSPTDLSGEPLYRHEKNLYGFVSIDAVFEHETPERIPLVHTLTGEGMNEFGMSISAQTMVTAQYQKVDPRKEDVDFFYFLSWALGNYKTADELVFALRNNVSVVSYGPTAALGTFHWAVTDSMGSSYVIEYVKGELNVWNNWEVGVITNDPAWDWHVQNLNTFATVTPLWADGGMKLAMTTPLGVLPNIVSNGYNLYGLPGDFTPQSRFVRMWYLRETLLYNRKNPIISEDDATVVVTAIMNSVFIPEGSIAGDEHDFNQSDYTEYDVIKFPNAKVLYFRTYQNMIWKKIDLNELNFQIGAPKMEMPIFDGQYGVQDVTANFN